jgi:uncharacterized protein (DUF58 family)
MSQPATFPGFRLRLTRWGAVFLAATLVLGFAAVNTGNNALMALLGVGLASFAVSGLWSRQVLGGADLELTALPKDVFAGRTVVAEVELKNRSRLFPAYGLVLRDREGRQLLVEPVLAAGHSSRRRVEVEFPNRGWAEMGPWAVDVLLPLGFFLKSKRLLSVRAVLVYPRLLASSAAAPHVGGVGRTSEGLEDRGREGEVVQLRGYRDGDDTRQMHWKQTARQQRPIVVDRQRRSAAPVVYVVDPRVSDPDDAAVRARFEEMISEVATAVVRRIERGAPVGLVVGTTVVAPVRSPRRVGRLLKPLAEVQPQRSDAPPPPAEIGAEVRICRVGGGP